jgi:hypothetical protein
MWPARTVESAHVGIRCVSAGTKEPADGALRRPMGRDMRDWITQLEEAQELHTVTRPVRIRLADFLS